MKKIYACTKASMDGRKARFVATTEKKDRYGEIVALDGWNVNDYMSNPVFLWAHDYTQPPIGKVTGVSISKGEGAGMVIDVEFADEKTYPFADTIRKLYEEGFLSAVSVGFIPGERVYDEVRKATVIKTAELLEVSAVPVPANPEALALAVQKGLIAEDIRKTFEDGAAKCLEEKAGRVLSKANETKLRTALDSMTSASSAIKSMLSSLEPEDKPKEEDEDEETPPEEKPEEDEDGTKTINRLYDNLLKRGTDGTPAHSSPDLDGIIADLKKI